MHMGALGSHTSNGREHKYYMCKNVTKKMKKCSWNKGDNSKGIHVFDHVDLDCAAQEGGLLCLSLEEGD